jgi:hypothetical protein
VTSVDLAHALPYSVRMLYVTAHYLVACGSRLRRYTGKAELPTDIHAFLHRLKTEPMRGTDQPASIGD